MNFRPLRDLAVYSGSVASLLIVAGHTVAAETLSERAILVDQVVTASFQPKKVFMLLEDGRSRVRQYPGYFTVREEQMDSENVDLQLLVGALVPRRIARSFGETVRFSFFLLGSDGTFAATPVKSALFSSIEKNSLAESTLKDRISSLSVKLNEQQAEYITVQRDLDALRERASSVINVDELVNLKMQLAKLRGQGDDDTTETDRLKRLVERARQMDDLTDGYPLIQSLSLDLTETARVTAMAERLNSRRRDAAKQTLSEKLALIQEMQNVDAESVGKQVLTLRQQRKQLEAELARIGKSVTPEEQEF